MDAQGKWQFYLGRAKKHRNLNLQVIAEEVETAKHNTRADKELISASALAAGPLSVVQGELRPKIL